MKYIKKYIKIFLFCFIFLLTLLFVDVNASSKISYKIGDHIYFDPVEGKTCNYKNYWTFNNPMGTCYRFAVIEDSSESNDTVKLMLDHNIAIDTFNNINNVLTTTKTTWKNYSGEVTTLSESEVKTLMKIKDGEGPKEEEDKKRVGAARLLKKFTKIIVNDISSLFVLV